MKRFFYVVMSISSGKKQSHQNASSDIRRNPRYPIPASTIRTELIVKRSRFITTVGPVDTVDAARAFIQQIRDEMPDASHHVYAFRVGHGSSVHEGLSDDGEPAGTSGKPTMAVLRGADVGDIGLVTTRYFGGTKLGTGGLVKAYSTAAKEALQQLPMSEKIAVVSFQAIVAYHVYELFKRTLVEHGACIIDECFAHTITVKFTLPEDAINDAIPRIREYTVQNAPPVQSQS
jgi:uncharacterized YigZ family protein